MSFFKHLINVLYPPQCHVCGSTLADHEKFICTECIESLPRTGYHRRELNPMEERFAGKFPFDHATGHFFYSRDSALAGLIQDMKYKRFPGIGETLGRIAAEELYPTGFFENVDVIVPIPMHGVKQMVRGYNQVIHVAKGIGEAAGLPVVESLKAVRAHRTQTSLTQRERRENTQGLFCLSDNHGLEGKGVLLVDDVCTTGSTLISAAETLEGSGHTHLSIMTLGVTF